MNSIPSYAPTPYAGLASGASTVSGASLDNEIKLFTTVKQRELYETLAELYAILRSLDMLERAYLRDAVGHTEYTPTCLRLLAQWNGMIKTNEAVALEFGGGAAEDVLEGLRLRYGVECGLAKRRIEVGVPATVEHAVAVAETGAAAATTTSGPSAKSVAEATGVSRRLTRIGGANDYRISLLAWTRCVSTTGPKTNCIRCLASS